MKNSTNSPEIHLATFGGGCFWSVEHVFRSRPGVLETACGYMGGCIPNPSYEEVCSDRTGHAEVVQVQFDPKIVSYEDLLELFWNSHDPTTPNRQGADVGTQYRSIIFFHTARQEQAAREIRQRLNLQSRFDRPIATHICPAQPFYTAEEYHQRYFEKNPDKKPCTVQGRGMSKPGCGLG